MLGTMIRIPLFVAIHPLAQFPSRALLLFFQTVDILYTDHSFFFFLISDQAWEKIAPGLASEFDSPYSIPAIAPRPLLIINGRHLAFSFQLG